MKVIFARSAEYDLISIADRIAIENPDRARTFILELRSCCTNLSLFPLAGRSMPERRWRNVRRLVYKDYLIFYEVTEQTILVRRVVHGTVNLRRFQIPRH